MDEDEVIVIISKIYWPLNILGKFLIITKEYLIVLLTISIIILISTLSISKGGTLEIMIFYRKKTKLGTSGIFGI